MGDSANFRYGKQSSDSGLEFVGAKKKSRFAQYEQQFNQPQQSPVASRPAQPVSYQQQPTGQQYSEQQPMAQTQHSPEAAQYYQQPAYRAPEQPANWQPPSYFPDTTASLPYSEPANVYENTQQHQDALHSDQQVYSFDQDDSLGMDAPNIDELFDAEPATQQVTYKKVPQSSIVRPMLDQKQRVSPLKAVFATLGIVMAFGVIGVSLWFIAQTRPAVSGGIKAAAGFPVYDLAVSSQYKIDKNTVEINENGSVVYIVYQQDNNARFVVSQQAIPDVIKEDSQYQQFLLETDKFASMESKIGKAYFTRPANIGTDISIVVKTGTTLMFIRGPGTTSEQDWSNLLAHLNN